MGFEVECNVSRVVSSQNCSAFGEALIYGASRLERNDCIVNLRDSKSERLSLDLSKGFDYLWANVCLINYPSFLFPELLFKIKS